MIFGNDLFQDSSLNNVFHRLALLSCQRLHQQGLALPVVILCKASLFPLILIWKSLKNPSTSFGPFGKLSLFNYEIFVTFLKYGCKGAGCGAVRYGTVRCGAVRCGSRSSSSSSEVVMCIGKVQLGRVIFGRHQNSLISRNPQNLTFLSGNIQLLLKYTAFLDISDLFKNTLLSFVPPSSIPSPLFPLDVNYSRINRNLHIPALEHCVFLCQLTSEYRIKILIYISMKLLSGH